MKKDINLLLCLDEEKKKSSSSMYLLLAVLVIGIIGAVLFMYINVDMQNKDKQQHINRIDSEIAALGDPSLIEAQITQKTEEYKLKVQEVLRTINSGIAPSGAAKLSNNLFAVLYDNYIFKTYLNKKDGIYDQKIVITSMNFDGNKVALSFAAKYRADAWDFVQYLMGDLEALPEVDTAEFPNAYVPTEQDKKDFLTNVVKNKDYFATEDIRQAYPGLPQMPETGEGKEYYIKMNLVFAINWEALAE